MGTPTMNHIAITIVDIAENVNRLVEGRPLLHQLR